MAMLKVGFLFAVAFLAAVAMFMGAVMMITSLQNGAISISYTSGGRSIDETVMRAADGARFWRLFWMMGVLPMALGALACWLSVRKLRAD